MGSLNFNSAIATVFLLGCISQNIGASTAEQSYRPCVQGPPGMPGQNGIPGIPGVPGYPGAGGEKGDKGEYAYTSGPRPLHIGGSRANCTQETAGLLRFVAGKDSLEFCDGNNWRSLVTEETQLGRSPTLPGKSCADIKAQNPSAQDGVYWVNPDHSVYSTKPFQIYCDMTTAGGGWSMCYTTDFAVKLKTEYTFDKSHPFGRAGYRGDCRYIPFKEVLYISHSDNQVAWFSKRSSGAIVTSLTNYNVPGNTYGLWTPHGVASRSYDYQFLLCDKSAQNDFYPGYFISGYKNCFKRCNNWCGDRSTSYFRTDGDSGQSSYDGVAFNVNGHSPLGRKLVSVGLRL